MSNSPLVQYVRLSPNHGGLRKGKISKITIHHMAGVLSVETCGDIFANPQRYASSNYGIGHDGRIALYLDEKYHPWTSSNWYNDDVAVTIEVSNSALGGLWPVSDYVFNRLIELVTDICKRNGIKELVYTGNDKGNLTLHKFFFATACPGPYLEARMPLIAKLVNEKLKPAPIITPPTTLYRVQVGAFGVYDNAVRMSNQLKAKGFDTMIVKVGTLFKVQTGAFGVYSNAVNQMNKLKSLGYSDAFITDTSGTPVSGGGGSPAPVPTVRQGSLVRVKAGTKDWNGNSLLPHVYTTVYYVKELSGGRAVLTLNGQVILATHVNNLYLA